MADSPWKNRWSKDQIRALLLEQADSFWKSDIGTPREALQKITQAASSPHAVIISGLRQVGKSTLLAQFAHQIDQDTFYYLNFEDDRFLGFTALDYNDLYEALVETFGQRQIFIIDEIQNIPGWEHFVRRFMDQGFKFYISGSNASLLSRELGTRLTGRYIPIELFPFSFHEYLNFYGYPLPDFSRMKTADHANLNAQLSAFLQSGGIPVALKYPEYSHLPTLYNDVLYRDIATRYQIEGVAQLRELSAFIMAHPASTISFNKLKERLQIKSLNTVKSYLSYLENSWLAFTINVYDYSLKRQQIAPKKVYCIDSGLANAVGFHFSANSGHLLENLVFLQLRRSTQSVYYLNLANNGEEIDFYLPEKKIAIQVCLDLNLPDTREREIRALVSAQKVFPIERALILTHANEETISADGLQIEVCSISHWLLESGN